MSALIYSVCKGWSGEDGSNLPWKHSVYCAAQQSCHPLNCSFTGRCNNPLMDTWRFAECTASGQEIPISGQYGYSSPARTKGSENHCLNPDSLSMCQLGSEQPLGSVIAFLLTQTALWIRASLIRPYVKKKNKGQQSQWIPLNCVM